MESIRNDSYKTPHLEDMLQALLHLLQSVLQIIARGRGRRGGGGGGLSLVHLLSLDLLHVRKGLGNLN